MKRLTILHSNDLHSHFDAWSRVEGIVRRLRREIGPDQILRLDAGDHGDRAVAQTDTSTGRMNFALLAAAGVDAFTFGNNESLVWPAEHQSELAQSAPFPVLAADLRLSGGGPVPGLRDWVVVERGGLKIGIFAVSREVPDFLEPMGLMHRDPVQVAADCARQLREQGCDLVIFLSHMGYENDRAVAKAVPGIDVIVGGHSHTALAAGDKVGDTVIVQAGEFGEYLGRLDLAVSGGRIEAWQASLLETATEPPDPETRALIAEWEAASEERLSEVVAHLSAPLPHDPLGESPLADLLVARLRAKYDADVAITHGGVLLGGLPAGAVTRGDLLRVCPWKFSPTLAQVKGQQLIDLLDIPDQELARKISHNGMRGDTPAGRIFGVGLEQIDPNRTYRVACNDYLAFGFAPFLPLRGAFETSQRAVEELLRDTLRDALTGQAFLPGERVRVDIYQIDGSPKKHWEATAVGHREGALVLRTEPGLPIYAKGEVAWVSKYVVDYYLWPDKEYNLFRFFTPEGAWSGDYYNVTLPLAARPGVITYVDLELDVYMPAGEAARLLDEDELEAAPYSASLKARVREIGAWLLKVAGTPEAPGGPVLTRPGAEEL